MTILENYPAIAHELDVQPTSSLVFDVYRNIHKGIRAELFAVTETAGSTDPSDRDSRAALCAHVSDVVELLVEHAEHEDRHVVPVLETIAPFLFERNVTDHEALDGRLLRVAERAALMAEAPRDEQRARAHNLYLDLASFTSSYLAHQEFEERIVMPALIEAIGVDGALGIHTAIVSSIPAPKMAKSLALMIPAMNIDDRVEMLAGMRANAPAPIFEEIWRLVASILTTHDCTALSQRLGIGRGSPR